MAAPATETISTIPIQDLELIRAALNSAYHHCTVLDLAEQYRRLTQRPQKSKLTLGLENALALISAYIEQSDPEDTPDD